MALRKIYASISSENNRSIRFHEKIGFEFMGGDQVLFFEKRLYSDEKGLRETVKLGSLSAEQPHQNIQESDFRRCF